MRYKRLRTQILLFAVVLAIFSFDSTRVSFAQAISLNGKLVYTKVLSAQGVQIISQTSTAKSVFTLRAPQSNCYAISSHGDYVAASTPSAANLSISDLNTGQQIAQYDWSPDWSPCDFLFSPDDTTLHIGDKAGRFFLLNILTGSATRPVIPTTSSIEQIQPPNWVANDFILWSPNPAIVVYNRCDSGQTATNMEGVVECTSVPDFVIYDLARQQPIQVLQNPSLSVLQPLPGLDASLAYPPYDQSIGWSPSGRYLAYLSENSSSTAYPAMQIVDVTTPRDLNTASTTDYAVDNFRGFYWSPDETRLAAWLRTDELETTYEVARLGIFDLQDGTFHLEDRMLNLPLEENRVDSAWSPDSNQFAFLDANYQLLLVNINDGMTSMFDTNVSSIVAWS